MSWCWCGRGEVVAREVGGADAGMVVGVVVLRYWLEIRRIEGSHRYGIREVSERLGFGFMVLCRKTAVHKVATEL